MTRDLVSVAQRALTQYQQRLTQEGIKTTLEKAPESGRRRLVRLLLHYTDGTQCGVVLGEGYAPETYYVGRFGAGHDGGSPEVVIDEAAGFVEVPVGEGPDALVERILAECRANAGQHGGFAPA